MHASCTMRSSASSLRESTVALREKGGVSLVLRQVLVMEEEEEEEEEDWVLEVWKPRIVLCCCL